MCSAGAWQRDDGRTAAVLHEVFGHLSGAEVCAAGGACRAWRRAAAAPALWRRLLQRRARLDARQLRALARRGVSWRREYEALCAGWRPAARAAVGAGAAHAALAPGGARLALVCDDATLQVWERAHGRWAAQAAWSAALARRGWRSAARVSWARAADRLLVAGTLELADSWELLVVDVDEASVGHVRCRARCSAGAGGCWADAAGGAFLSLELCRLAPRLAVTTVWLNAAGQETQSEYAGVRAPLLRVFTEDGAHITLAEVVQVPLDVAADDAFDERAVPQERADAESALLVTASGCRSEAGGSLCAWGLSALRPPPLCAAALGDLRERVRRRAARPAPAAAPEPAPPDEASVRALCSEPEAACALPAPPVGLAVDPSARCVWAALGAGGAWCVSLPALRPLRCLSLPAPSSFADPLHYVQPAISDTYFASPCGARGGAVHVWGARSGAAACGAACGAARHAACDAEGRAACGAVLPHAAPARAALLPHTPHTARRTLLVLAGEHLYVWESRAPPPPPPRSNAGAGAGDTSPPEPGAY